MNTRPESWVHSTPLNVQAPGRWSSSMDSCLMERGNPQGPGLARRALDASRNPLSRNMSPSGSGVDMPAGRACLCVFLLLTTGIVRADAVVRLTVGGDVIALPGRASAQASCKPCVDPPHVGDLITVYEREGAIRRDRGGMSIILRKDSRKVYFICHGSKQFAEIPYPVRYEKYARRNLGRSYDDLLTFEAIAPGKSERRQIKEWPIEAFTVTVANGMRNQFRVVLGVATGAFADDTLMLELRKILNEMEHSGHGWSRLLPIERGLPLLWEEVQPQPETEFVYREEVTGIENHDVSSDMYGPPKEYGEMKFDPDCFQFR